MADLSFSDIKKLRVSDLRTELSARGLKTTGIKKVLCSRLYDAIQEEGGSSLRRNSQQHRMETGDFNQANELQGDLQSLAELSDCTSKSDNVNLSMNLIESTATVEIEQVQSPQKGAILNVIEEDEKDMPVVAPKIAAKPEPIKALDGNTKQVFLAVKKVADTLEHLAQGSRLKVFTINVFTVVSNNPMVKSVLQRKDRKDRQIGSTTGLKKQSQPVGEQDAKAVFGLFLDKVLEGYYVLLKRLKGTDPSKDIQRLQWTVEFLNCVLQYASLSEVWDVCDLNYFFGMYLYLFVTKHQRKAEMKAAPALVPFFEKIEKDMKLSSFTKAQLQRMCFLPNLLFFCTTFVLTSIAKTSKGIALLRAILALLSTVLNDNSLRRFATRLIRSSNVLPLLVLWDHREHDLQGRLEVIEELLYFPRNVHTNKLLSAEQVVSQRFERIKLLQRVAFQACGDQLRDFALVSPAAAASRLSSWDQTVATFKKLGDEQLWHFLELAGLLMSPETNEASSGSNTPWLVFSQFTTLVFLKQMTTMKGAFTRPFCLQVIRSYVRTAANTKPAPFLFPNESRLHVPLNDAHAKVLDSLSISSSLQNLKSVLSQQIAQTLSQNLQMSLVNLIKYGKSLCMVPLTSCSILSIVRDDFGKEVEAVVLETQFCIDYFPGNPVEPWDSLHSGDVVFLVKFSPIDGQIKVSFLRGALVYDRVVRVPPQEREKRALRVSIEPAQYITDTEALYEYTDDAARDSFLLFKPNSQLSNLCSMAVAADKVNQKGKYDYITSEYNLQEFNKSEFNPNYNVEFSGEKNVDKRKLILTLPSERVDLVSFEKYYAPSVEQLLVKSSKSKHEVGQIVKAERLAGVVNHISADKMNVIRHNSTVSAIVTELLAGIGAATDGVSPRVLFIGKSSSAVSGVLTSILAAITNRKLSLDDKSYLLSYSGSHAKKMQQFSVDQRIKFLQKKLLVLRKTAEDLINCFEGKVFEKASDFARADMFEAIASKLNAEDVFTTCESAHKYLTTIILPFLSDHSDSVVASRLAEFYDLPADPIEDRSRAELIRKRTEKLFSELSLMRPLELLENSQLKESYVLKQYSKCVVLTFDEFLTCATRTPEMMHDLSKFEHVFFADAERFSTYETILCLLYVGRPKHEGGSKHIYLLDRKGVASTEHSFSSGADLFSVTADLSVAELLVVKRHHCILIDLCGKSDMFSNTLYCNAMKPILGFSASVQFLEPMYETTPDAKTYLLDHCLCMTHLYIYLLLTGYKSHNIGIFVDDRLSLKAMGKVLHNVCKALNLPVTAILGPEHSSSLKKDIIIGSVARFAGTNQRFERLLSFFGQSATTGLFVFGHKEQFQSSFDISRNTVITEALKQSQKREFGLCLKLKTTNLSAADFILKEPHEILSFVYSLLSAV